MQYIKLNFICFFKCVHQKILNPACALRGISIGQCWSRYGDLLTVQDAGMVQGIKSQSWWARWCFSTEFRVDLIEWRCFVLVVVTIAFTHLIRGTVIPNTTLHPVHFQMSLIVPQKPFGAHFLKLGYNQGVHYIQLCVCSSFQSRIVPLSHLFFFPLLCDTDFSKIRSAISWNVCQPGLM